MAALANPFCRGFQGWSMLDRQNHAAGGAKGSIMVGMYVSVCFTSKKPSEQEFFCSRQNELRQ
jgi:hypothetical protein